ncbi:TetR/AcrR family transcriptional regulator [Lactococcus nasutitermitis]|uniref:TetR/AcrR family transcriptional regulator n=1 Tax=Lactococcus nasutitermitis TaxID=1652957 RepID=A0ABV9JAP6_9LACT|nr:TetR/AcrR family transcriptional regulator [Lactococcus nasutitermitis]
MSDKKEQFYEFHHYIVTATMQLLDEKTLTELAVTDICKRAGVSRPAFYRHFKNKEQIVLTYFTPIYENFLTELSKMPNLNSQLLAEQFVNFFANQGKEIRKATRAGYYLLIFQVFAEKIADFYNDTTTWTDYVGTKRQFWNDFMAAGLFYVLGNWAKNNCPESREEVVKMVIEFHE